jgi:predicted N-acyltransferase
MNPISIRPYTEVDRTAWDTFVENANNGTVFHKQAFLAYHAAGKFRFHHLMLFEAGELVAVLPGGLKKDFHERDVFWSPVGASYGGLVTGDVSFERALALIDAVIEYGKRQQWSGMYVIPPPIVYNRRLTQHIEYAMLYRAFVYEYHYISHTIDVAATREDLSDFDKTARKTVRKILRDEAVNIHEASDEASYRAFYEILLDNKRKHNATPTHTLDEILRLRELVPESLRLLMVTLRGEERPIAGSLLFLCNPDVMLCFYNMLLYEYQHLKPIYLVMHDTVRLAREEGFRWVDIGVSQMPSDPNPMTPALSLIEFKERFNARGFIRSTYYRSLL